MISRTNYLNLIQRYLYWINAIRARDPNKLWLKTTAVRSQLWIEDARTINGWSNGEEWFQGISWLRPLSPGDSPELFSGSIIEPVSSPWRKSICRPAATSSSATSDWCPLVTIIATIANNWERFDTRVVRRLIRLNKVRSRAATRRERIAIVVQNRRPWIGTVIQDGWACGRWTLHDVGRTRNW